MDFATFCTGFTSRTTFSLDKMSFSYTRALLFNIRNTLTSFRINSETATILKCEKIFKARGSRGGQAVRNYTRRIPVVNHTRVLQPRTVTPNRRQRRNISPSLVRVPRIHALAQAPPAPVNTQRNRNYSQLPVFSLTNARSLCNKMTEFRHSLVTHQVDVACVSETWFKPSGAEYYGCENYVMFSKSRETQQGGGVAAYVSGSIPTRELDVHVPDNVECLWLYIRPHILPRSLSCIILAVLYNPPHNEHEDQLLDHLVYTVDCMRQRYPDCGVAIMGDFNLMRSYPLTHHLGLKQVVAFRTLTRGSNTLDCIYTNFASNYLGPVEEAPLGASDHVNILWKPQTNAPTTTTDNSPRFVRPLTETNIASFIQIFDTLPLSSIDDLPSLDLKTDFLQRSLQIAYTTSCPLKKAKLRRDDKPWLTPQTKELLKKKRTLFRKFGANAQYKKIRNRLTTIIKRTKGNFYHNKVASLRKQNPRDWHRHVQHICGKTTTTSTFLQQSNPTDINQHFAAICSSLPGLDRSALTTAHVDKCLPSISAHDLYRCILRLNDHKAVHPSDIPTRLIKAVAFDVSVPLAKIMNSCLQLGSIPAQWKTAVITPVPKVASPKSFSELRPISVTPRFSKLWESMITPYITSDIHPSIDLSQFGNMPGLCTSDYLVQLFYHILSHLDTPGSAASACLIDFSKAFDRVNHTIAVNKLMQLGMRSSLVPSICSFLENRTQQVKLGGALSPCLPTSCGLPQGTLLGPLLFLAMINDCTPPSVLRYKYVDDITVLELRRSSEQSKLSESLDAVAAWSADNDMQVNHSKTAVMHFDFAQQPDPQSPIRIGNSSLTTTTNVRLLGIRVTSELRWDQHVKDIIRKASGRLQMLRLAKQNGIPERHLLDIYYSYVRPSLEYAAPVWSTSLPQHLSNNIEQIQRRAFRIILGVSHVSYRRSCERLQAQTLSQRRNDLVQRYALSLPGKAAMHSLLAPPQETNYNLRSRRRYMYPKVRTERFRLSTIPYCINVLNNKS